MRERVGRSSRAPPFVFVTAVVRVKNGGEKGFARNIVNVARISFKLILNDVKSQGDHFLVWWFVTKVRNKKVARGKCFGQIRALTLKFKCVGEACGSERGLQGHQVAPKVS